MRLVHELLNDVSVDMNMDVTHAESYKHNRQTQRRKKVVNTLYKETAEKINAKQPNRTKKIGRRCRWRRRWCIECCRLFKARDEELEAPRLRPCPLTRPTTTSRRGRPGELQQEGGGSRKPLGRIGAVSAAHNPADLNNLIQLTKSPRGASTRRLNA
jgi:hypothetical protein